MKFVMQSNGILALDATVSEPMSIWTGERLIGQIEPGSNVFPWRGLVLNAASLQRFGIQLRDEKGSLSGAIDAGEFVKQYLADDFLLEKLQRLIMPGIWELYTIGLSRNTVIAEFGVVFTKDLVGSKVNFTCNDISASKMIVGNEPHFSQSYWFMPENCILGYRCEFELEQLTDFLKFQIHFDDTVSTFVTHHYQRPQMAYTNMALLEKLPNIERIRRVSGAFANQNSFLNGGRTAHERIKNLVLAYGDSPGYGQLRILDWGVGCGRVARFFSEMENVEVSGADIDEDNVGWCKANLRGDYRLVPLAPPTSFSDNTFDVIYSCSVLSHLTEEMTDVWLNELARILKPGGLALLSFNGSSNLVTYLGHRPQMLREALTDGFFDGDINRDLEGFIPSSDYYRATFAGSDWWKRMFEKHFHLVEIEYAVVSGYQDVAVLRRKRDNAQ